MWIAVIIGITLLLALIIFGAILLVAEEQTRRTLDKRIEFERAKQATIEAGLNAKVTWEVAGYDNRGSNDVS